MNRFPALLPGLISLALVLTARAAVLITHYNTYALLDSDGFTPLVGTSAGGDLVQILHAGLNGIPDIPDTYGAPGGDDIYLPLFAGTASTHVGDNEPAPNWNLGLYNDTVTIDDVHIGGPVFLRFWNSPLPASATHYGDTTVLNLPAAPLLGPAFLDFVPTSGSARAANISFSALDASSVPEPSTAVALLCGIAVLATGRGLRRHLEHIRRVVPVLAATGLTLGLIPDSRAQLNPPLDVTASRPILGPVRDILPGDSTDIPLLALAPVPGALVQILTVGANGQPDLPAADGTPAGDDILVVELAVGLGIAPNLTGTGRFSATVRAAVAPGTRIYARAFNGATRAASTHWGQSAAFTVQPLRVMDVSALGLVAATLPLGADWSATDTDGDGVTDLQELLANTSATDASDRLRILSAPGLPSVRVRGQPGRRYVLERATDIRGPATAWTAVQQTAMLPDAHDLLLSDPQPPAAPTVFYRVRARQD